MFESDAALVVEACLSLGKRNAAAFLGK